MSCNRKVSEKKNKQPTASVSASCRLFVYDEQRFVKYSHIIIDLHDQDYATTLVQHAVHHMYIVT